MYKILIISIHYISIEINLINLKYFHLRNKGHKLKNYDKHDLNYIFYRFSHIICISTVFLA
jgi:hypothetical protein